MAKKKLNEKDLKRELQGFREQFPRLAEDELFVLWFIRAFVTENEEAAVNALTGTSGDKGTDAILILDKSKDVYIIQGKYREIINHKAENRSDIISFADIAINLSAPKKTFDSFLEGMAQVVQERMKEARERIVKRDYRLQLYYATLGKCSEDLEKEAINIVRRAKCHAGIEICGGQRIMLLLADYLEGVAPPVPSLDLEMESGHGVVMKGILQRHDKKTDIESWIFSMSGQAVAEIFERTGPRIFARNVRGFLENTDVNKSMVITLKHEPEFFWYYNNGITIVCDSAEQRSSSGKDILHVDNPQIINGQQTTRTLHRMFEMSAKASVPVRVIRVLRDPKSDHENFENLVSCIVRATNWQNAIQASDLVSNDRRQIEIERALRKIGYLYMRKRQAKSEVRGAAGANKFWTVSKEEIAQAVASCDLDPVTLRLGKGKLFEEEYYKTIFPNANPDYYLTRYWLMKRAAQAAKGYPERAYAKWLVIYFLWSNLNPIIRSGNPARVFRQACEKNGPLIVPLKRSTNSVFNAALAFYRHKRGKGATAIDVSSFFRRKGLPSDFLQFWSSNRNKHRRTFEKSWQKFRKSLEEAPLRVM